jgi:hypothetical protein
MSWRTLFVAPAFCMKPLAHGVTSSSSRVITVV